MTTETEIGGCIGGSRGTPRTASCHQKLAEFSESAQPTSTLTGASGSQKYEAVRVLLHKASQVVEMSVSSPRGLLLSPAYPPCPSFRACGPTATLGHSPPRQMPLRGPASARMLVSSFFLASFHHFTVLTFSPSFQTECKVSLKSLEGGHLHASQHLWVRDCGLISFCIAGHPLVQCVLSHVVNL